MMIDYGRIGDAIINAIIERRLIRVLDVESAVIVWNPFANNALGEVAEQAVRDATKDTFQ